MEIWVATNNRGKLNEVKQILHGSAFEVHTPTELGYYTSPEETGSTFEENARIKAKSLHSVKSDAWVIADDSGLEVEGLNNLPGVHSARYAGPKATDPENVSKLLKMISLRSALNRNAKFKCVIVAYSPEGKEYIFDGELSGQISKAAKGQEGFGYDPVFVPEGETKTLAELGVTFKNTLSHRAMALKKLAEVL